MDVRKLPAGPPPKVDALVGTTLFHDGKAIVLEMKGDGSTAWALGSLDGTPYITHGVRGGDQLYRVGDDGSLTAVGTPHETYDIVPRLSTVTGHVFFGYNDRSTAATTLTEVDARTGEVLHVFNGWPDDSRVDPGDRPLLDAMRDPEPDAGVLLAVSPDGRTGLDVQESPGDDHPNTEILDQWSLGSKPTVVRHLTFLIADPSEDYSSVGSPVFEDDDTFLVEASLPNWSGKGPIYSFVVRCTLEGACERTTEMTTGEVSIAGVGAVFVPGHFPSS